MSTGVTVQSVIFTETRLQTSFCQAKISKTVGSANRVFLQLDRLLIESICRHRQLTTEFPPLIHISSKCIKVRQQPAASAFGESLESIHYPESIAQRLRLLVAAVSHRNPLHAGLSLS